MVSQPKPPDPMQTAAAQGAANRSAAQAASIMNNANERTPFGRLDYSVSGYEKIKNEQGQDIKIPRYTRTVKLSRPEQRKLDETNNIQIGLLDAGGRQVRQASRALAKPFNFKGLPGRVDSVGPANLPGSAPTLRESSGAYDSGGPIQRSYAPADGFSRDRMRVEGALMSRLTPQFERDRSSLENRLVSQGLQRGTEQFTRAMDEIRRSETDARFQAVLAGGEEQSRLLGEARAAGEFGNAAQQQQNQQNLQAAGFRAGIDQQNNQTRQQTFQNQTALGQQRFQNDLTRADFANAARERATQERVLERTQPLNELTAAMNGGQVNVPQFANQYRQGIEPSPIADLTMQNYAIRSQNAASANAGLFGLGSAVLGGIPMMFSDKRVKKDIARVGKTDGGLPLYRYRYKGGDGPFMLGVMAQDVEKKTPEAVHETADGIKAVDYSLVE